jgi:hypothetical protein
MTISFLKRKRQMATLIALIVTFAVASASYAALCVWRKPDQDIKKFYPGAQTYRTDLKKPTRANVAAIEKRLGTKLDSDETEFSFYRILRGGRQVGTVLTHLGRGQYGAIEIVVALDNNAKVTGVAIQRDRERQRAELRSDKFLDQFKGKTKNDPVRTGRDITPVRGAEQSSEVVAFSVRKLLIIYDVLN